MVAFHLVECIMFLEFVLGLLPPEKATFDLPYQGLLEI